MELLSQVKIPTFDVNKGNEKREDIQTNRKVGVYKGRQREREEEGGRGEGG